ncbi:UDP-phosphate galactose phosphotransferase [Desulfosporosinus sp. HMP52]|nr:UDP-phosphate galactose phosphotransferase [Desulfosporosinus sp. HMP52]
MKVYKTYIKRLLDIIFALLMFIPLLLVVGICAFLIKMEDKGPAFYCGERLGKDGEVFKMYKLRTMKVNAPDLRNPDGSTYNSPEDSRLTRIGSVLRKTSLDELPQIINILIGNMSFIGPRPDLPEHIHIYVGEDFRKLEVLPGISGYNQANLRNGGQWKERLKNDVYYVNNISFLLDLEILFKTIKVIVRRDNVYTEMPGNMGVKTNGRQRHI